jgi:hypothetical protein
MKIDFEFQTEYGLFRDALYFPDDAVPTDEEIELLKQARVDKWLGIMNVNAGA